MLLSLGVESMNKVLDVSFTGVERDWFVSGLALARVSSELLKGPP